MKKTIIAGVVVSALTASSAFAIEGGLASQNGFPAALEEIKTALNDPNGAQFARAQDVAMRRLGLNFNDAEVFVSAVRSGKDVSHFGEPAVPPAPTYVAPVAVPHATPTAVPVTAVRLNESISDRASHSESFLRGAFAFQVNESGQGESILLLHAFFVGALVRCQSLFAFIHFYI